jgi:hypothetical protein
MAAGRPDIAAKIEAVAECKREHPAERGIDEDGAPCKAFGEGVTSSAGSMAIAPMNTAPTPTTDQSTTDCRSNGLKSSHTGVSVPIVSTSEAAMHASQ